ncbi:MAG: hypothetical protein ACW9W4_08620 [Candidatus Nitrosopumilus sp. bin_7KS]
MKTRLLIMFTIGIIGLTGLSFPFVFACECVGSTLEQRIENSDVIFSGKLYPNVWDFSEHKIAGNFNVIQVWKGADSFPQIVTGDVTVVTGVDSGICGVEFVPNNKYLIFAKIDGDVLATSSCSGSWFLDGRADDVKALNAMKAEPEEPEPYEGIFSLREKQVRYNIPYVVSNGMIDDMTLFCEHGSLLIDVSSQNESDVTLDIELPRNVLDPKTDGKDSQFFILRDGDEIDYDEIPYQDYRKISMSFSPDTDKIEIIHAFIPELKPAMCKVVDSPPHSSILPPLKQFKFGIPTDEILCKDGLTMLLSPKDSRPVCVTGDTASKLIPRHWGILVSRG